jgi:DNA helicase HerA-like ATPase
VTLTDGGWSWPAGLDAYRITEIPRRDDGDSGSGRWSAGADPGRPQRAAALTAAYHTGAVIVSGQGGAASGTDALAAGAVRGMVAFGWIRPDPAGPVHVVVAGNALAGSVTPRGDVLVCLPGGARGTALPPGDLNRLLNGIGTWREIAAISDGLLSISAAAGGSPDISFPGGGAAPGFPPARGSHAAGRMAPGLEDGLLDSWTGAFGWMIVATPLPAADLRTFADDVARRLNLAQATADRFPERAVEAQRLSERHAEARRGNSSGFWSIRFFAGGPDAASADRVTGLLCASAALDGLPYTLVPASVAGAAPPPADGGGLTDYSAPVVPFRGSTELLAALARPPETEVPGVRLTLRPEFDVTSDTPEGAGWLHSAGRMGDTGPGDIRPGDDGGPECMAGADPGIVLGDILDRNLMPAGPFRIRLESLNRHVFVCGATGAGKSHTVRSMLEAATAQGIPWLVIEPAKAEYRLMAARLGTGERGAGEPEPGSGGPVVVRIRPGEADAIAAGLNPLAPATADGATFPLQTHADLVRALFVASFRSDEPFPQVLSAALTRVYEEAGWDLALGEPRHSPASAPALAYPTLGDLQRASERVVTEIGYSQRVTDDVLGFIRVRLASLRAGTTGRFLDGGHPIDFGALLRHNVVLEIEDIGDDRDKAFLMGTVLIRLVEHLRLTHAAERAGTGRAAPGRADRGRTGAGRTRLRHLTVVEEAHRLLRRSEPGEQVGSGAHAVEMFAGLLAEIRAYGEGLIIAEQIPARILSDVIKNTAVKITHRLPAADDRDAVGATMNATPAQSRYLVTLPPGRAAAFTDGMDFPVLVEVPDATERELDAPVPTADPGAVCSPRSDTCGKLCATRLCTLREMRLAQRAVEDYPWLRLWAELTVLAHLAGRPVPVPEPDALAALKVLAPRLVQCALSHVTDAVAAEWLPVIAGIPVQFSPGELAVHTSAVLTARAERDAWVCAPDEPRWRLPGPVAQSLLAGATRILGSTSALPEALETFIDCDWPLTYLRPGATAGTVPGPVAVPIPRTDPVDNLPSSG